MSVLSRSVTAAQRGRSFTGAPAFGAEEGAALTAGTCRCHTGGEVPPGSLGYATVTVLRPAGSSAVPFPGPRPAPEGGRMNRLRNSFADREAGMATAEYAIATLLPMLRVTRLLRFAYKHSRVNLSVDGQHQRHRFNHILHDNTHAEQVQDFPPLVWIH